VRDFRARLARTRHPVLVTNESREPWYAERGVIRFPDPDGGPAYAYEERITLWRADSFEDASLIS
jgi:hypothetical protein